MFTLPLLLLLEAPLFNTITISKPAEGFHYKNCSTIINYCYFYSAFFVIFCVFLYYAQFFMDILYIDKQKAGFFMYILLFQC